MSDASPQQEQQQQDDAAAVDKKQNPAEASYEMHGNKSYYFWHSSVKNGAPIRTPELIGKEMREADVREEIETIEKFS